MKPWTLLAAIALSLFGICQTTYAEDRPVAELRAELEAMLVSDQAQRTDMRAVREKFGQSSLEYRELLEKQHAADDANVKRLTEIVESRGWPEQSKVGGKAAIAAFLVLQHAGLDQQKQFLPMLRDAVAKGEALPQNLALLEDRILVRDGRPQIYGSQLRVDPVTGKHSFHLIEDEANVDKRRAAVGLGSLTEYAKRFGFVYPSSSE